MKGKAIKLGAKIGIALATIALMSAAFYTTACNGGGGSPSINSFTLLYDIVAIGDPQGAMWSSSKGDNATIKAIHENGTVQYDNSVPVNSDGVRLMETTGWPAGEYKVILKVSNSNGSADRERSMLLVGPSGLWFDFTKYVDPPKVNAWTGFVDALIPVSLGQGADDQDETVSISKYVNINRIKWNVGVGAPWPDRSSCPEAQFMSIRKGGSAEVFEAGREYVFPWQNPAGNYYCTSIWEPCAISADRRTWFVLSIEALSQL